MALVEAHEDAIDVALIDALHAFSNETGGAEAYLTPDTEQCRQYLSASSRVAPLILSRQTSEADVLDFPPPHIINGTANGGDLCPDPRYMGHGHFNLIDARSTSEIKSKKERPAYRYATLIAMAILQANDRCLPLAQIYQWISDHFPFYSLAQSGWQNSVRHNLSVNKSFVKIERPSHDPGKGHYWGIKPGHEHEFTKASNADCSTKAVGASQTGRDWIQCPAAEGERLLEPNTSHSVRGLCSSNKTFEEHPQRVEEPSRVSTETSGPFPEQELRHPSVTPSPLTPLPFLQPRRGIVTSPLPWEGQTGHTKRKSCLDTDEVADVREYVPSDDKPVTHVYLPHLMRDTGSKCRQFKARRPESEIALIRRSRT